jgi:hypothetical protein
VAEAFQKQGSFGLAGIRERVTLLGGHFDITSRQRKVTGKSRRQAAGTKSGTKIRIELPVPASGDWGRAVTPGDLSEVRNRRSRSSARVSSAGKSVSRAGAPGAQLAN